MYSCLLKKLVPFALTFVVGATIGGFFKSRVKTWTSTERTTLMLDHGGYGYGHSCRMYRRDLVAETKPLVILFKPDANYPHAGEGYVNSVWVRVTFGSDGKVQDVQQLQPLLPNLMLKAVDRAARQIQFTPETVNSVPVSVTKDIEIHFMGD
jgi:hypothetical protein